MSYDFDLLRIPPGRDLQGFLAERGQRATGEQPAGMADPEKEARKRLLADALIGRNPALSVFPFDYAQIAKLSGMSEEEARRSYRHLELNGPDDGNGIQITLFDDEASITVPYWHEGEAGRRVMMEIWEYLRILQQEGGFVVYDPQLDRILDLSAGFEVVLGGYTETVGRLPEIVAEQVPPQRGRETPSGTRPWWKFW